MRSPTIGLIELGKYLTTSDTLKRSNIIKVEKKLQNREIPPPLYDVARVQISRALEAGLSNLQYLEKEEFKLRTNTSVGYERQRNSASADAIEAFRGMHRTLDIDRCITYKHAREDVSKLYVDDVAIRSAPEILLTHLNYRNKMTVGAIKLYLSKNEPLSEEAGLYSATLLRRYVESFSAFGYECNPLYCYVVDVFAGREPFHARKHDTRLWRRIQLGCQEIRRDWSDWSA